MQDASVSATHLAILQRLDEHERLEGIEAVGVEAVGLVVGFVVEVREKRVVAQVGGDVQRVTVVVGLYKGWGIG